MMLKDFLKESGHLLSSTMQTQTHNPKEVLAMGNTKNKPKKKKNPEKASPKPKKKGK